MPSNSNQIDKLKDCKTRGFGLSFCVLLHSHLYWVYSILYIAYRQITLDKKSDLATDRTRKKKIKHSHHKRHAKRKSLTLKPKIIVIPTTKPKPTIAKPKALVPVDNDNAKDALLQQKVPLLQALRTFPSSSSKKPLHIHQLIKSHSTTVKRSNSTGHIRTGRRAGLLHPEEETSSDELSIQMQSLSISKRDRAMDLLRLTFQRSNSTGHLKQGFDSSFSSEDEGGVVIKKRKRDTIFALTRKFSSRKNAPTIITTETTTTTTTDDDQSFETDANKLPLPNSGRSKLFRNLASWKKDNH
ncbi:hypothetical protein BD408DRAFT_424537, partial [Parasitella parasitica]